MAWSSAKRVPPAPNVLGKAVSGDFQASALAQSTGGQDWANPVYANYYAQSVPTYRAVKLRADAIASAPLIVYRRKPGDVPEAVPAEHPVQQLLAKVNPWWTAEDLLKATETYLCLFGSAFWFVDRNETVPTLWALRPDKVRIIPDRQVRGNRYITGYRYSSGSGQDIPLTVDEVVWFRYFNPLDEFGGLSPVAPARVSLDMGKEAVRYNRQFFANSAMPQDIIFPVQGPIPDEEVEDFYRRLDKRFKGSSNAFRPMIWDLSQGGEPKRLGLTQRDMEFMAALNFTVEDAARVWGVPPPKMYSQTQSIYNNVKQADIEFYSDTISNEWKFLEAEINELFIPLVAGGDKTLYVAFDTSQVLPLQEAMGELHDRVRQDVQAGILTINEARAARNLEPVEWGETWWVPFTLAPAGTPPPTGDMGGVGAAARSASSLTDPVLDSYIEAFVKGLTGRERRFAIMQRDLFDQQRADVLNKLGSVSRAMKAAGSALFDASGWETVFKRDGAGLFASLLTSAAQAHASAFGLGSFDPNAPMVRQLVTDRVALWARMVNEETARLLLGELQEAQQLGESIRQMQVRIEKVFNFNDAVRTEMIARTETVALSTQGHLSVYEQSGVVQWKQWIATMDERTRETHLAAHKQTVRVTERFLVGGEMLEGPGIGGSAGMVINCRCAVAPVVSARGMGRNGHTPERLVNDAR